MMFPAAPNAPGDPMVPDREVFASRGGRMGKGREWKAADRGLSRIAPAFCRTFENPEIEALSSTCVNWARAEGWV
jgi:hypothetical protein